MWVCAPECRHCWRPEALVPPGARKSGSCEHWHRCWKPVSHLSSCFFVVLQFDFWGGEWNVGFLCLWLVWNYQVDQAVLELHPLGLHCWLGATILVFVLTRRWFWREFCVAGSTLRPSPALFHLLLISSSISCLCPFCNGMSSSFLLSNYKANMRNKILIIPWRWSSLNWCQVTVLFNHY